MMDCMKCSYDWGMGWGMPFFGLFFWALIIIGIVFLVRRIMGRKADDVQESHLDILKKRYASGQIGMETYESMKMELNS